MGTAAKTRRVGPEGTTVASRIDRETYIALAKYVRGFRPETTVSAVVKQAIQEHLERLGLLETAPS